MFWDLVAEGMINRFFIGRGKRKRHTLADYFFMGLCCLKPNGKWKYHAVMFRQKPSGFEKRMWKTINVVGPVHPKQFIEVCKAFYNMVNRKPFKNKYCAKYATDVRFQQCNLQVGTFSKSRHYYSGKHSLYGFKTEVSMTPTGQAIFVSDHLPGTAHDMELFRRNLQKHKSILEKKIIVISIENNSPLAEVYPDA